MRKRILPLRINLGIMRACCDAVSISIHHRSIGRSVAEHVPDHPVSSPPAQWLRQVSDTRALTAVIAIPSGFSLIAYRVAHAGVANTPAA